MIASQQHFYHQRPPYAPRQFRGEPKPPIAEETLDRGQLQIGEKTFVFQLKANERGRFLRIVEHSGEYVQSVMIPESGFEDFLAVLSDLLSDNKNFPPALGSAA